MPTRIRLQRHGKKGQAFFHIVIADGRAPRDGKFIERIGTYNPNTNPATIDLNFDKTLGWMKHGAVPTDTCRAILSYKGLLYKHHLDKGVLKGALTQEAADAKFEKWKSEKEGKIETKISSLSSGKTADAKKRFQAETAVKEAKAKAIASKNTPAEETVEASPEAPAESTEEGSTEA